MAKTPTTPRTGATGANASGDSPMYVLFGAEGFLRGEAQRGLIRRLGGGGITEFDASLLRVRKTEDGKDAEPDDDDEEPAKGAPDLVADIFDAVRTADLFASRNIVLVRSADGFVSAARAMLERYLDAPAPGSVLILECRSFASNTKLYKRVAAFGAAIACEPLKGAAVTDWAEKRVAQAYGKKIESSAARVLADLVGADLGRLDSELSKLAAYVGARPRIERADVEELVGSSRIELVFGVTDALARGDAGKALDLWDRVLANDRDAPYKAVGGLAYGVRRLAEAERIVGMGGSTWDAVSRLRLFIDPAALGQQLKRLPRGKIENMLLRLRRIDAASKSGGGEVQLGVEKFIAEFSGKG